MAKPKCTATKFLKIKHRVLGSLKFKPLNLINSFKGEFKNKTEKSKSKGITMADQSMKKD